MLFVAMRYYKLLLQIHDEVILEGPSETATEALNRVVTVMQNPLDGPLRVTLEVDAKTVDDWSEAK